jgi:thiol-disulfide isomerase/thioredoxin
MDADKKVEAEDGGQAEPDDDKSNDKADERFLVHAVRPDTRGVTFSPEKVVDGTLIGTSDLLGDCSVKLASIQSLLFGRDVGEKALALRKESWKLELAALPKAYLDDGESDTGASAATSSPLVGKNAPEITLQTIDDVEFVLSENRDKVIVLDFWASWCGPCIATMPKVDEIVGEFDPRDVELVAVNLQDSVERARIALKRMEIEPTVVMDVDGETARFYDARAIPQTVIVDRKGKITHLFVGGGSKFLDQFSTALKEVVAAE